MENNMKNPKIYITESGVGVIDMPEKPDSRDYGIGCRYDLEDYTTDLKFYESLLSKAKEGVVLFKDQDLIHELLELGLNKCILKEVGSLHDLPKGYRVGFDIVGCNECKFIEGQVSSPDCCGKFQKIALLLPIEQEQPIQEPVKSAEDVLKDYNIHKGGGLLAFDNIIKVMEEYANQFKK